MPSVVAAAMFASGMCLLQIATAMQMKVAPSGTGLDLNAEDPPPPRIGKFYPRDPKTTLATIKDLQAFMVTAKESARGYASILFMGDSTMAGLTTDLINITDDLSKSNRLLHSANDMPVAMKFSGDGSDVAPGTQWYDPASLSDDDADKKGAVERAVAAHHALKKQGCSWSGHVETFMFTGEELKGLIMHTWSFLPDYGHSCWKGCFEDAIRAFDASAVVWNVGLHITNHKFDASVCGPPTNRQPMAEEQCGDYQSLVKSVTGQILGVAPIVIFRTTNFVCDSLQSEYDAELKDLLAKWEDPTERLALETECQEQCPLIREKGITCYDWVMNGRTTDRFYTESMNAIRWLQKNDAPRASSIRVLDTYNPSKQCCEKGCNYESEDGEHYRGLDREMLRNLALLLRQ